MWYFSFVVFCSFSFWIDYETCVGSEIAKNIFWKCVYMSASLCPDSWYSEIHCIIISVCSSFVQPHCVIRLIQSCTEQVDTATGRRVCIRVVVPSTTVLLLLQHVLSWRLLLFSFLPDEHRSGGILKQATTGLPHLLNSSRHIILVFSFRVTRQLMVIMSMGREYVSELRPPTCLLYIPQVIYEHGKPWSNHIDRRNTRLVNQSYLIVLPAELSDRKVGITGGGNYEFSLRNACFIFRRVL
jgi:hypothetical protein